jgi:hypothetical protein
MSITSTTSTEPRRATPPVVLAVDPRGQRLAAGLTAAVLNAVFGLCLGCEMYLLLARLRGGRLRSTGQPA